MVIMTTVITCTMAYARQNPREEHLESKGEN